MPRILALVICCCMLLSVGQVQADHQLVCVPGSQEIGDYNGNGDVSLPDTTSLVRCLGGPTADPPPRTVLERMRCLEVFDSQDDGHVDLSDVGLFLRSFTGDCTGLGTCPPGAHLEHNSGELGVVADDDENPSPIDASEYRCVTDETCRDVTCKNKGTCEIYEGRAACACPEGYAGESCELCAVGYELAHNGDCVFGDECRERYCSGQGDCILVRGEIACDCDRGASGKNCREGGGDPSTLRAPTWIVLSGTDISVELGEPREICATMYGGGIIDTQLNWQLVDGPGTLFGSGPNCYTFVPPPAGAFDYSQIVEIEVCSQNEPAQCANRFLTLDPQGAIRVTGQSHAIFKPFDDNMREFMLHRCIGGGVLGISVFGKPVFIRGYGNLSGAPTNTSSYLATCGDIWDVSNQVSGYTLPEPTPVLPNSPFRIGSNSKSVTAAILRKVIKAEIASVDTDDEVEGHYLCDGVLSPDLNDVACNGEAPPVALFSASGSPPDCDASAPCPYGGNCVVLNEDDGTGFCANCPAGYTGFDCTVNLNYCSSTEAQLDSRWESVTLGHLLGHTSGMPRTAPSQNSIILPNLDRFRDLSSESDWQADELSLTSQNGFPSGLFFFEFPNHPSAKMDIGNSAHFVEQPTVTEAILARMGACLLTSPGVSYQYSNTGYALLGTIAENVSGIQFAATTGRPTQHIGSLLESFMEDQVGVPFPGQSTAEGMYVSQNVFDQRNSLEPIWRDWSDQGGGTYYALVDDTKRPYCNWSDDTCSFSDWINSVLKFDWGFLERQTMQGYHGSSYEGPKTAGSLAVEAEVFLRYMAKYWVGGKGSDPLYGESRCPNGNCIWALPVSHTGSLTGTYSVVKQLGGSVKLDDDCETDDDCSSYTACDDTPEATERQEFCLGGKCRQYNEYVMPPVDPSTGLISDDFRQLECNSCRLPVGVDIFVAFNQREDMRCVIAGQFPEGFPGYYACKTAYKSISGVLDNAACKIAWPANPTQLWPPVTLNGGSSMSPEFAP